MIATLLLIAAQLQPQPVAVTIQNPSFEAAVPVQYQRACGAFTYETPPGWTSTTGTVAILVPANPNPCGFSSPPDGKQMVAIQNGTLSQDLGDVYAILPHDANGEVNGVYTVRFFVANYFYWYPGQFSASLSLFCQPGNKLCAQGTTKVLCSISGIGGGDFLDVPLVCRSQRQYGELSINLGAGGYQMLFDNVSLAFTPVN